MIARFPFAMCCVLLACRAQNDPKPVPPDPQKVLAEVMQQFQKEGIVLDAKAGTVAIKATVNAPQDPVEYLLIHRRGKRHEAIFVTKSKPSVLNGALLMLGLSPGKNASYVEKKPAPTLEEVQAGADPIIVTPPSGTPLWMTVRWTTPEGKPVEHCIEDMVFDLGKQKAVANCSWVYLGGRMAQIYKNDPEVYVADLEGNLVSICYLSPDNHLGTMVHEQARDDQNWWTTTLVPPAETEVEFVFHKAETPLHQERSKRLAKEAAEAAKDGKQEGKGGKDGKDEKGNKGG
ncbi:MAG: YdjY domain-containing protein [Planctomycetota bacterium]